jgi:hypothetical protein
MLNFDFSTYDIIMCFFWPIYIMNILVECITLKHHCIYTLYEYTIMYHISLYADWFYLLIFCLGFLQRYLWIWTRMDNFVHVSTLLNSINFLKMNYYNEYCIKFMKILWTFSLYPLKLLKNDGAFITQML